MPVTDEEWHAFTEYERLRDEYFDTVKRTAIIILDGQSHLTEERKEDIVTRFVDTITGRSMHALGGPGSLLYDLKTQVESDATVKKIYKKYMEAYMEIFDIIPNIKKVQEILQNNDISESSYLFLPPVLQTLYADIGIKKTTSQDLIYGKNFKASGRVYRLVGGRNRRKKRKAKSKKLSKKIRSKRR